MVEELETVEELVKEADIDLDWEGNDQSEEEKQTEKKQKQERVHSGTRAALSLLNARNRASIS